MKKCEEIDEKLKFAESFATNQYIETLLTAKEYETISFMVKKNEHFSPLFQYEKSTTDKFDISILESSQKDNISYIFPTLFNFFLRFDDFIFAYDFLSKMSKPENSDIITSLYGIIVRCQYSFVYAFEQSLITKFFSNYSVDKNLNDKEGESIERIISEAFDESYAYLPLEISEKIMAFCKNYRLFLINEFIKPTLKTFISNPRICCFISDLGTIKYDLIELKSITNKNQPHIPFLSTTGFFDFEQRTYVFSQTDWHYFQIKSIQLNAQNELHISDSLKMHDINGLEIFIKRISKIKDKLTHFRFLAMKQLVFNKHPGQMETKSISFDYYFDLLKSYEIHYNQSPSFIRNHMIQYLSDLSKVMLIHTLNYASLSYDRPALKYNANNQTNLQVKTISAHMFNQTHSLLCEITSDRIKSFGNIYETILCIAKDISIALQFHCYIPKFISRCLKSDIFQKYLYCTYLCACFLHTKCKDYPFAPISADDIFSLKNVINTFYDVLISVDIFLVNAYIQF